MVARRAADAEKPARHFLPRADFGERAVFGVVEVYLQAFWWVPMTSLFS